MALADRIYRKARTYNNVGGCGTSPCWGSKDSGTSVICHLDGG